jgi:hypothetical protein
MAKTYVPTLETNPTIFLGRAINNSTKFDINTSIVVAFAEKPLLSKEELLHWLQDQWLDGIAAAL